MAKVLIADDDANYLDAFCDGVEALGHIATGVPNGRRALAALEEDHFDIVFLDVVMGDGGGISVLHDIRESWPDLPVVIITGRSEVVSSPIFKSGLRAASAKLPKTTSLAELDLEIRRLTRV
ncbi:response regulator [Rhodobacterales bacterium HKCCE3408]|nr:response regulator [Rhodobacterales bacterium HKCCE3408]